MYTRGISSSHLSFQLYLGPQDLSNDHDSGFAFPCSAELRVWVFRSGEENVEQVRRCSPWSFLSRSPAARNRYRVKYSMGF